MKLKNKKKVLLSILTLSLALSSTSCGSDYQKNAVEEINELMDEDFYKEDRALGTNEEFYGTFYRVYLNNFVDYMSKKQYKEFKNIVSDYELLEECDYEKIADRFTSILCEENSRGIGIYAAFNSELLYEELNQVIVLQDEVYERICNIKFLIGDDDAFYKALFSKDIDELIKLICKNTGCEEKLADVLVYYFDQYYEGIKTGTFSKPKDELAESIDYVIEDITEAKIDTDENFKSIFYGRMFINNKRYEEQVRIKPNLIKDSATIYIEDDSLSLKFDFDSSYLYSCSLELWQLKVMRANEYINEAYSKYYSDSYDLQGLSLLSLLLSQECNLDNTTNEDDIRCEIYDDLSDYFTSPEDFNNFIIKLFRNDKEALDRYFEIFKKRIQEDGIDAYDFMRYASLRNLVKNKEIVTLYLPNDNTFENREKIKNIPKEEALNYADVTIENYYFDVDYNTYFQEIDEILKNNDLGLTRIINDQVYFNWWYKPLSVSGYSAYSTLVSKPVEIKNMNYNGIDLLYFEAPKGFENGYLAEVFYNIEGNIIIRKFEGLNAVVKNPDTNEDMYIIAVSLNDNREIPKELMFVKTYLDYDYTEYLNQDAKKLTR